MTMTVYPITDRPASRRKPKNAATKSKDSELLKHAQKIRQLVKATKGNITGIGRELVAARRRPPHGQWGRWLKQEFAWSEDTASRFIAVYEYSQSHADDFRKLRDLAIPVSAFYVLANPNTPEAARTEVIQRAEAGETINVASVRETIRTVRGEPTPTASITRLVTALELVEAWNDTPAGGARASSIRSGSKAGSLICRRASTWRWRSGCQSGAVRSRRLHRRGMQLSSSRTGFPIFSSARRRRLSATPARRRCHCST
jgi:DUF3102 family protein